MATLQTLLQDIGAIIAQDTSLPTGTDLNVQVQLINNAIVEWASAYQWRQLRFTSPVTFALSATSLALPANFKKLMSPIEDVTQTPAVQYVALSRPEDRFLKSTADKYIFVTGNLADGQALNINPALASGVSLVYDYQAYPSSLATLQDTTVVPNPQFIVKRTLSNLFAARSDPRFPSFKADADDMLSNMIEEEATPSGAEVNQVRNTIARAGFRIGRD